MPVIYRLLGNLEIGPDDQPLKLPRGHHLTVLAALLINANHWMSKRALLIAGWGSDETAEAQLYKAASALRTLLAEIGRGSDLLTHPRFGYEIQAKAADLDTLQFRQLLREAVEAGSQQRSSDEATLLRRALALWRGQHPLANVSGEAFTQEINDLEQRHKRAAIRLFDLELARARYEAILDELAKIAGYYPDEKRLAEQLMIVQYRCGHLTDATRTFDRYGAALAELTGGDPDKGLRQLNYAIGSEDEQQIAAAEAVIMRRSGMVGGARSDPRPAIPRQLPPDPADLVGRDDLVAEASWLLKRRSDRAVPVVVICGPGGIGKTALARRVAHLAAERYPDGQLFAELGGSGQPVDPCSVLAQFLRALGISAIPQSTAERVAAFRTLLADRRVLIVLDDAAGGAQVRDLIPANPACGVLVTARLRLPEIGGAHHVPPLSPLPKAAATELFLRVTGNARIDLRAELDAVDLVVKRCGGLPLALRIAAALRVHDHPQPTSELAARLAVGGPVVLTYGDESVARTINAGFEQLGDDAQRLFLDLGVLALPSFGLWTAAALLEEDGVDPAAALSQLAARYMIEAGQPLAQYRFHDLTRDYARQRAEAQFPAATDRAAIASRAYRALLTLTRRAHAALYGGDFEIVHSDVPDWDPPPAVLAELEAAPLEWFEQERLNIRAAVTHCASLGLTDLCWDLAVSAHEFYTLRRYFDQWQITHSVALEACRAAGDRRGEGVVLACLGQPALVASRRTGVSGLAELERAVSLLAESGDQHGQAIALRTLANALRRRGHLTRPLELFTEALGYYTASGDELGRWQTLRYIGTAYLELGRHEDACSVLRDAEAAAIRSGNPRMLAQTRFWLGQGALATGDLHAAQAAFTSVHEMYPAPSDTGHAYAVLGLGCVALRTPDLAAAERHLGRAADLARDGTDAVLEGRAWLAIAELRKALGQAGSRLTALKRAVSCLGGDSVYLQAQALAALARAQQDSGSTEAARATWARVENLYTEMGLPEEDRIYREPPRPPL